MIDVTVDISRGVEDSKKLLPAARDFCYKERSWRKGVGGVEMMTGLVLARIASGRSESKSLDTKFVMN